MIYSSSVISFELIISNSLIINECFTLKGEIYGGSMRLIPTLEIFSTKIIIMEQMHCKVYCSLNLLQVLNHHYHALKMYNGA